VSPRGERRPLALVCRTIGLARSSAYAARPRAGAAPRLRPGPKTATSDALLLGRIREVLAGAPFSGEGHRKVWARLRRLHDIRVGRKRVLRLMRAHGLLAPSRQRWTHSSGAHRGTIVPGRPNELWGTDATRLETTTEGWAWVFVAIDHHTLEPWATVSKRGDRFAALTPVLDAVRERFGAVTVNVARGVALRHDHGPQYISHHFSGELHYLGIADSPAYVREPEGNGVAEWFIKQLKEQLLWCERFATVAEAAVAVRAFCERFRQEWIVERLGYRTPAEAYAAFIAERAA
jgi:putative transposase